LPSVSEAQQRAYKSLQWKGEKSEIQIMTTLSKHLQGPGLEMGIKEKTTQDRDQVLAQGLVCMENTQCGGCGVFYSI
jgi:hypothetical protein